MSLPPTRPAAWLPYCAAMQRFRRLMVRRAEALEDSIKRWTIAGVLGAMAAALVFLGFQVLHEYTEPSGSVVREATGASVAYWVLAGLIFLGALAVLFSPLVLRNRRPVEDASDAAAASHPVTPPPMSGPEPVALTGRVVSRDVAETVGPGDEIFSPDLQVLFLDLRNEIADNLRILRKAFAEGRWRWTSNLKDKKWKKARVKFVREHRMSPTCVILDEAFGRLNRLSNDKSLRVLKRDYTVHQEDELEAAIAAMQESADTVEAHLGTQAPPPTACSKG